MKLVILKVILSCLYLAFNINGEAQSLPELLIPEESKIYSGMYNDIAIKANNADPKLIKIKAKETHLKKVNDTLYQIMLRSLSEGDELKVKLYYKNLPVDIAKMLVSPIPSVKVSINGFNKSIKLSSEDAQKAKITTQLSDDFLQSSGYKLHTFSVKLISSKNKMLPLFQAKNGSLDLLSRFKNRIKKGDKLILTDFRMSNRRKHVINCQSNYLEIIID